MAPPVCPSTNGPPTHGPDRPAAGVSYEEDRNIIRLRGSEPTTLPAVAAALDQPDLLQELAPGEWLLNANLRIDQGAELAIAGPQVRWLKLRSDGDGFVWIKALGGHLTINETCISSWDPARQQADEEFDDGRSYVLARDGATMNIRRSVLHHLGYLADQSYGVSYRLAGTGGEVVDSEISHNYYGIYTHEVSDLQIRNNEVHHNHLYGIDPHTGSNRLLIEGNRAYANGKHGIILADHCSDSVIRDNISFDNGLHGIVLYDESDNNLLENNTVYGNSLQGININDANHNTIRGNLAYDNGEDGIGVGQKAEGNRVEGNTVRDNKKNGIYLYSEATATTIAENLIANNSEYGIYVKSPGNLITTGNQIYGNQVGIYLNTSDPPEISLEQNTIVDNADGAVKEHSGE